MRASCVSKIPPDMKTCSFPALLCLLASLATPPDAEALHPRETKLNGRAPVGTARGLTGDAVAVTERWIVVGEPDNGQMAIFGGTVHVFDARTGRYVRRLFSSDLSSGDAFGSSVSVCGNRLLVGAPHHDEDAQGSSGAAYLFDLLSGRELAKLVPAVSENSARFGHAVCLSDRFATIGAPAATGGAAGSGAVYLFDASTFQEVVLPTSGSMANTPFRPNGQVPTDVFGNAVAQCGSLLLVGDPGANAANGRVFLFDINTGLRLRTWENPGGANMAEFGTSVALDGGKALVGAPNDDEGGGDAGAAYLFDAITGQLLWKTPGEAGEELGESVSMSGNLALIGARLGDGASVNSGVAYLHAVDTGNRLGVFQPGDGATNDDFGAAVSICGHLAVVGTPGAEGPDGTPDVGAVYFYRPLAGPLPVTPVARARDSAPGTDEADFGVFRDPGINEEGEVAFCATVTGTGALGGKNKGLWNTQGGPLRLIQRSTDDLAFALPNVRVTNLFGSLINSNSFHLYQGILVGAGVNATNNRAIFFSSNGDNDVVAPFRTGIDVPALTTGSGNPRLQAFRELSQSADFNAATLSYLLRSGPGGVNATNDTGIMTLNVATGAPLDVSAREGGGTGAVGAVFRQFFGRAAAGRTNFYTFGAFHVPAGATVPEQGLFFDQSGGAARGVVATLATAVPGGAGGETFRAFTGETGSTQGFSIYRAALTGTGVTAANNEGLWEEDNNVILYRKGAGVGPGPDPDGGGGSVPPVEQLEAGVVIQRILSFWPVGSDGSIVLVKLRGPGVTAANDCALFYQDSSQDITLRLLREGDAVCDWDCPKIGAIQRVDVNPVDGRYAIVVSLTGSPARNQALLTGRARFGLPTTQSGFRYPVLRLRKGTYYDSGFSQATRLRGIALRQTTDRTGSGGKGLGQSINDNGQTMLCLIFDNLAKELVISEP